MLVKKEEQGPDLCLYLKQLKSLTKYMKQWFSDIEQLAAESSGPWEKENKLLKLYDCFSLLPGESFQTTPQGERIQAEPRVLSELRRQRQESGEAKAVRICRVEYHNRESYKER